MSRARWSGLLFVAVVLAPVLSACGGPQQPSPTPDAQTAVQDACANLLGGVPYDIAYTSSITQRLLAGTTVATETEYDARINDRGDYHAIVTRTMSEDQRTGSGYWEEISIDGSAYMRFPEGPWQESAMTGGPSGEGVCSTDFAGEDEELNRYLEQYTLITSYTDLGSKTLNGVEMRHIRLSSQYEARDSDALEPSGFDVSALIEELVDEFWVTPNGQIAQFRQAYQFAGTTIEGLGVISGVGEPNVIELSAPAPTWPPTPTPEPTTPTPRPGAG